MTAILRVRGESKNMKYKMLAMDMDGTLLSDDKVISERSRKAIKSAYEKGIKIVICTGRIFISAITFKDIIGLDIPIIASNGAYIKEKDGDEVMYTKPLGEKNAKEIIKLARESNMYVHMFSWDTIFTDKLIHTSLNYSKWNKELPNDRKVKIKVVEASEWDSVIRDNKDSILKSIIVHDDEAKLDVLRNSISKLDVEIVSSFSNNFEVMNKGVSKGNAVKVLSQYYNIDRDEIICMGDAENDISMIKYAGLGIAMGNGTEEVKKAAKFTTLSNDDDGVAYAIEKFVLNAAV